MEQLYFTGGRVFAGGALRPGSVLVRGAKIAAVTAGDAPAPPGCRTVDLRGAMLVPGFLDIHTHGGGGVDVNAADAAGFAAAGRFFAAHGVTGWLCSIVADSEERTLRCIAGARAAMAAPVTGARLLGIHLEGPFLAPAYRGAVPERYLRAADPALFHRCQRAAGGAIRYLTAAPEVAGVPELIGAICGETVVAIGHSGADYETAVRAIRAGARAATHIFNAMRPFDRHQPGIAGAVLEYPVFCEAICDGRHLHPGAVRMLLACKGWDRVVAVTDSIQAAGLPDGRYRLGVNDVTVCGGDAVLTDTGVRAGSTLTMDEALRNLVKFTGRGPESVLPLLTENPARLLGLAGKGRIAPGYDADLTVLDGALTVRAAYVAGTKVFGQAGRPR